MILVGADVRRTCLPVTRSDKAPHRHEIDKAVELAQITDDNKAQAVPLVFRDPKESQRLSAGRDGADVLLPES